MTEIEKTALFEDYLIFKTDLQSGGPGSVRPLLQSFPNVLSNDQRGTMVQNMEFL